MSPDRSVQLRERTALYYPYIKVPDEPWFTRVLLYWDRTGAIVPEPLRSERGELGDFGTELLAADLLHLLSPEQFSPERNAFGEAFLECLESDLNYVDSRRRAFADGSYQRLHVAKADRQLLTGLNEVGVARSGRGPWWIVEDGIATEYMAGLAAILCQVQPGETDPVTNRTEQLTPFGARAAVPQSLRGGQFDIDLPEDLQIGQVEIDLLEVVLPSPSQKVTVSGLVSFKERHGELLGRLRAHVERKAIEIAEENDPEIRRRKRAIVSEELAADLAELDTRMRERRWQTDRIGSTLQIVTPLGGATGAVVMGSAVAVPIVGGAIALLAVAHALARSSRSEALRSPLAFASLARHL